MPEKSELRKKYKKIRKNISNKTAKDDKINDFLIKSEFFIASATILFYAALPDEINTDGAILYSLEKNKAVALPYCIDNCGKMQYYYIKSLNDLKEGSFGVREPDISRSGGVSSFENTLCVVPGLAFDKNGFRLGYGKGYYDRFLENFTGVKIGLCYDDCFLNALPVGKYDLPVDYVITENGVFNTNSLLQGGKNG